MRRAVLLSMVLVLPCLHCGRGGVITSPGKASSPSSSPAAGSSPSGKFDFKAEMKKEASGLRAFTVSAPDAFSATVSAAAPPKVSPSGDRAYTVAIDIGTPRQLDCAVFARRIDPATTAWKLAAEPLEKYPEKDAMTVDVGVDDDHPVMTLNMLGLNEKKEASLLKVTIVVMPVSAVVCRHDDLGYVATTKTATLELARSLRTTVAARPSRFHDLAIVHIADTPVGFFERFILDGDNPDQTFETEYAAMIVAKSGEPIYAADDVTVIEDDRDGFIRAVTKGGGTPDGLTRRLVLKRTSPTSTEYDVEGEQSGQKVQTKIKAKRPLRGAELTAKDIIANARAPRAAPLVEETWSSKGNAVTTTTYTRAASFDPNAPVYTVKSDDDVFTMAFDAQGVATRMTSEKADFPLEAKRVFARGSVSRKK